MKAPRPVYRRAYPNLDSLFGHVYSNLTGEPLTPTKVATFYLLRILFQTHFGLRHKPSFYGLFHYLEKQKLFHWLYALMSSNTELTYKDYRLVTRMAFGEDREINQNFYASMEQLGSALADINFGIEDEFYTNTYAKDPNLRWDDMDHDLFALETQDDLHFTSNFSFVYRWLKGILAQYTKTSNGDLFKLNLKMRQWILAEENNPSPIENMGAVLPYVIDCSMRARKWTNETIFNVQKDPTHTMPFDDIFNYVRIVQKRHPDVIEAFLLEAIIHIQMKDGSRGMKALKSYFELSMFELNSNMVHCMKTYRLGVPNFAPLMYSPILQARICRLFGDYPTARVLLDESLRQAQIRNDEICHQMANVEMHTCGIIGCGPILEDNAQRIIEYVDKDRRILRKALRHIDDLHGQHRTGPCCLESEDDFEVLAELDSYGKMVMILKTIAAGHYKLKYNRVAETGFNCQVGSDSQERGQKVFAFGYSIMSSNMIRNGLYSQGKKISQELLSGNLETDKGGSFHTEPFAVGMANLAYSHAAAGNYMEALTVVDEMKIKFPEELVWQGYRHTHICETIINFEKLFLMNKYNECNSIVGDLATYSELEYRIRRCLLLSALGRCDEGTTYLMSLLVEDVYGNIRILMQRATIYTANKYFGRAAIALDEALILAEGTTLLGIKALIRRRMATMMMCQGRYRESQELLDYCFEEVLRHGTFIEKACLYMTAARTARFLGKDPRDFLRMARTLVHGKWPAMEKLIFSELSFLHKPDGLMPNTNRLSQVCEQFGKLTDDYPGRCDWLLL
ncbi:hypothetical protein GCK72_012591 [Caenorhabditis remanei]|uniref:Uncharacterized protein n=1 Tax=Caenorhabditis remanei TaxID=31234 RepID=A0A6A5GLD6_CAERE|nr:hypothetical protein GCK72_012591 [Caenorhabditis remanei]KAF1756138.1 hypothetical protein GCK72_012591 [Caenorhabditis remanei]